MEKNCCLLLFFLLASLQVRANNEFSLSAAASKKNHSLDLRFSSISAAIQIPVEDVITGLSVSGQFEKHSPDYLVRIVLTDTNGNEHLVMESYEEINSDSIVSFDGHCEETALLDRIMPDSMKIFLRNATLHLNSLQTTNYIERTNLPIQEKIKEKRENQIKIIVNKINDYNRTHDRLWVAGETELSKKSYQSRKQILALSDSSLSSGIEYYAGGIFEIGHNKDYSHRSSSPYVDSFDWRNWNGRNWMTPIKDQKAGSYCTTFAIVGEMESLVNLYYNRKIDCDLSEMELVCCSDTVPHTPSMGFSSGTVMSYATTHGVCDEESYPYNVILNPICRDDSITPNEIVTMNSYHIGFGDPREYLFKKGPLEVGLYGGIFGINVSSM